MIDWLARMVEPLNTALFTIGTDEVSWAEFLGFVTGGLCVAGLRAWTRDLTPADTALPAYSAA